MKRMRILGLALVAVFAVAVAASASASAAPTWFECAKVAKVEGKYHGKFSDKACTVGSTEGKYELAEGIGKGKAFKGKGGESKLRSSTPFGTELNVTCGKFKDEGHIANVGGTGYAVGVTASFSKCEFQGEKCTTPGAKTGEIKTKMLAGPLGYINDENPEAPVVGQDLASEAEPGGSLAEFNCTIVNVHVIGSVIGQQAGDINAISKTSSTIYAPGKYIGSVESEFGPYEPVVNVPKFEGGPAGHSRVRKLRVLHQRPARQRMHHCAFGSGSYGREQRRSRRGQSLSTWYGLRSDVVCGSHPPAPAGGGGSLEGRPGSPGRPSVSRTRPGPASMRRRGEMRS